MDLAVSTANLGLWDWNLATDEIWSTKHCREMFGLSETGQLTRQTFADTVHEEDRGRVRAEFETAMAIDQPLETEYRVALRGGEIRWLATKGSLRGGANGEPERLVGVVLDVTARKQAELEAEQQRQEMAHLTRVSVLGALSGALAHELNQPLTAILSNAQAASRIIARKPVDIEEISQILQDIMQDDKRAGDVIKHLRALLKKEESQMQPVA